MHTCSECEYPFVDIGAPYVIRHHVFCWDCLQIHRSEGVYIHVRKPQTLMEFAIRTLIQNHEDIRRVHELLPAQHPSWEYIAKYFSNQDVIEDGKEVYDIILTHMEW